MAARDRARQLLSSVLGLGAKRLAALAVIGATVFGVVTFGALYLSRAETEVLYAGLDGADVGRIGAALTEAGIAFDVNAKGDTVLVKFGEAGRARMLLAERGLPNSDSAGYELFNDLGSLGLTSFMQEVTRVRALEGEIARTIQLMRGVKAARVHLVLPDDGSFRRDRQPASASVVLRIESADDIGSARAIQHLVAAAVPGMTPAQVTVLNTDGMLMAGGEGDTAAPVNMVGLEQVIAREIRDNVRQTLTPYLGLENFQVSVAARLNADKQQVSETIFDPESRVERSVRVVRQNELEQNSTSETAATVEQNLPEGEAQPSTGEQSSNQNERREELTNYELSTKTITTVSDGYGIERLSIAVLIHRAQLAATLGENPTDADIDARLDEIRRLVVSAAGLDEARGDTLEVSAVEFHADARNLEPVPPPSLLEVVARQSGTFINAGTILLVSLLVIWFGLRPATKALLARAEPVPAAAQLVAAESGPASEGRADARAAANAPDLIGDLTSKLQRSPQKRLAQIVDFDEQRAASILRQWVYQDERAS
jgi:flagellar M-ring protein FliF